MFRFLITTLLLLSSAVFAKGPLLLIGGGNRPTLALEKFVDRTTAEGLILVIPWASGSIESALNIKSELELVGANKVEIVPHKISNTVELTRKIESAAGIFFTGGNQNTLMNFIHRYQVLDLFKKRHNDGMAFAGTSAGTAIMSHHMLNGNGSQTVAGLGLLPQFIVVDQHFVVRNRWQRLANIVKDKKLVGIGIDEDNAIFIENNHAQVTGPTMVQVIKVQDYELITNDYHAGESFPIVP